jgi:hypothetical protein
MLKRKRTNGQPLQNTTQKTTDWSTQTPLKTGGELSARACGSYHDFLDKELLLIRQLLK